MQTTSTVSERRGEEKDGRQGRDRKTGSNFFYIYIESCFTYLHEFLQSEHIDAPKMYLKKHLFQPIML